MAKGKKAAKKSTKKQNDARESIHKKV